MMPKPPGPVEARYIALFKVQEGRIEQGGRIGNVDCRGEFRRRHRNQPLGAERHRVERRVVDRAEWDPEVGAVAPYAGVSVRGQHAQFDVGMSLLELGQTGRKPVGGERGGNRDGHRSPAQRLGGRRYRRIKLSQRRRSPCGQGRSNGGRLDTITLPNEEGDAQGLFEASDRMAHCGLADPERKGGTGEAARFDNGDNGTHRTVGHPRGDISFCHDEMTKYRISSMTNIVHTVCMHELAQIVDLDRYPLHEPESAAYATAVAAAREGLRSVGCAVVKDLVRPEAVTLLNNEIVERKHTTHFSTQVMNPYFHTEVNDEFSNDHPVNTFLERSSGFIPGDSWEPGCATDVMFRAPELARFLADCLEIPELHCYADPLAGLTANILDPGQLFTWHFDTNDFAVTVLVQEADEGGLFEYSPAIRNADDEGFDRIAAVLAGEREGVHTLDLRPGDLQIFRGRHSLHQVSRVPANSRPRHAAIFAYTEEAGVIGRLARTQQLFGRVLQAHVDAEEQRIRSDALID